MGGRWLLFLWTWAIALHAGVINGDFQSGLTGWDAMVFGSVAVEPGAGHHCH